MPTIEDVRARALRALIPPPRLRLSDWIEQTVNLPAGVSALPGPVRLWRFQREIADAIGDPTIERVTLVKPVRVGFTTLLTGALASFVANEPAPILALLPTEADARRYMVDDIEPIFSASPTLAGALTVATQEGERNTILSKRFPGGSLKIVAAKSPRNLRSHNVRVLFIDEADVMEVTSEGSPILLAERRTLSFPDRKIVLGSTPVMEDTSHVLRAWKDSDQRVFEIPCPDCGSFTEIEWSHIRWDEGKPETARWCCPACGSLVEERHKVGMVDRGRWRATKPDVRGHAGFRLSALIAPHANASWPKLVSEFLAAKDDPSTLQTFVNTILGQGWRHEGDEMDDAALAARAEPFGLSLMPADVQVITAGVDVQRDRVEMSFLGWGADGTAFILGHSVVWGQWDDDLTWAEVDATLATVWDHPEGRIGVSAALIDSGDGITAEKVVSFCRGRWRRLIFPCKGDDGMRRRALERPKPGTAAAKSRLHIVGVDPIKQLLRDRLARPGSIRFSDDLEPYWFEQFAAERRVIRYSKGHPEIRFELPPGRRNEALDCVVYAFAARQLAPARDVQEPVAMQAAAQMVAPKREPSGFIPRREGWLRR